MLSLMSSATAENPETSEILEINPIKTQKCNIHLLKT